MRWPVPLLLIWLLCFTNAHASTVADYARVITPLINRTNLATLRERGANPRVQKYVHWLALADREKVSVEKVSEEAVNKAGYSGEAAKLTKAAMLRNLHIATRLGTIDEEGMSEMRKGNAATIRNGPYKGDQLSVDHIVPRSVCPELDNVIANLEFMAQKQNSRKNATIGRRQKDVARKLHQAGLLSKEGLKAVEGNSGLFWFR